ncbi:MAG: phage terminase small subunit P27 family [Acidobacteriota bacterium]
MARPSHPPHLAIVRGTDRRSAPVEPPKSAAPTRPDLPPLKAPTWLSREAAREWRRVVTILEAEERAHPLDRALLASFCELWAELWELHRDLRKNGRYFKTPTGFQRPRPQLKRLPEVQRELRQHAAALQFAPSTRRSLVGVGEQLDFGGLEEALGGGG